MPQSYAGKLRDPRWQKKRLEIFARDAFTCQFCKSGEKELHVHHTRYLRGVEPWDHPNDLLITLCDECHRAVGSLCKEISEIAHTPRAYVLFSWLFSIANPNSDLTKEFRQRQFKATIKALGMIIDSDDLLKLEQFLK